MYSYEIIAGLVMFIALLLLIIAGLSSELIRAKRLVSRMCRSLDQVLKPNSKLYKK